jgi:hypothetical protein
MASPGLNEIRPLGIEGRLRPLCRTCSYRSTQSTRRWNSHPAVVERRRRFKPAARPWGRSRQPGARQATFWATLTLAVATIGLAVATVVLGFVTARHAG